MELRGRMTPEYGCYRLFALRSRGGRFARLGCARTLWSRGIDWEQVGEWSVVPIGFLVPSVVRLFELNQCAIPLTLAGSGGFFAMPAGVVVGLDLGTQVGEADVLLTGGLLGAASFRFLRERSGASGILAAPAPVPRQTKMQRGRGRREVPQHHARGLVGPTENPEQQKGSHSAFKKQQRGQHETVRPQSGR